MNTAEILPAEFKELEKYLPDWALHSEEERFHKLAITSLPELQAFFETMLPRMDSLITYLSAWPLEQMPDHARHLYDLLLTFAETAHPIELGWKNTINGSGLAPDRLAFHGPSKGTQ